MVAKYKISMTLSAEEFMTIFPRIGADVQLEIKKIDTAPVSKEPRAPRQLSTGKLSVNEAILQTLSDGPASVSKLKEALIDAGKSAGLAIDWNRRVDQVRQDRAHRRRRIREGGADHSLRFPTATTLLLNASECHGVFIVSSLLQQGRAGLPHCKKSRAYITPQDKSAVMHLVPKGEND